MKQIMKKFLLAFSVFFVAAFLITNTVLAAAQGAMLYNSPANTAETCAKGADDTSGPTFGFVVMNINDKDELIAEVSLIGATPNETYDIWVNQDPGGNCPLGRPTAADALKTNNLGNGKADVVVSAVPGAEHFWVSVTRDNFSEVLRSPAVNPHEPFWKFW